MFTKIKKLNFFKNKDYVFLANFVPLLYPLKLKKGEYAYKIGEYPNYLYFLYDGRINLVSGLQ